MKSSRSLIVFSILVLYPVSYHSSSFNETNVFDRQKRTVLFPSGGTFKLVLGMVTPVKLTKTRTIAVGWNFQFQYAMPVNTTVVKTYPPILSRRTREDFDAERNDVYDSLDNILKGSHKNLEDCLLRYICEEGYSSFYHHNNGVYGHILHLLLSPDKYEKDTNIAYLEAQKAGKFGADCKTLYSRCEERFLFDRIFPLSATKKEGLEMEM